MVVGWVANFATRLGVRLPVSLGVGMRVWLGWVGGHVGRWVGGSERASLSVCGVHLCAHVMHSASNERMEINMWS